MAIYFNGPQQTLKRHNVYSECSSQDAEPVKPKAMETAEEAMISREQCYLITDIGTNKTEFVTATF